MSLPMHRFFISLLLLSLAGCSKKEPPPVVLDPATQKQMDLLIEAVQTVASNYVDESKVAPDQLIASTILGMIAPVDSRARVVPAGGPDDDSERISMYHAGDGQVLSLRITAIDATTRRQLRKMEKQVRRTRSSGILLDVRGTTGHDYETALGLAGWFLPVDAIIGTLERKDAPARVVSTRRKPVVDPSVAVVLLIDESTEDAAEWIAAALKHHHRVILVGRPSRGLGLIRDTVPVTAEWNILMTAGIVRTPDGTAIDGAPVQPDVLMNPWSDDASVYRAGMRQLAAGADPIVPPED